MAVATQHTDTGLVALAPTECVRLLRRESVGRLATSGRDGALAVLPVDFTLDGEAVVFRAEPNRADSWHGQCARLEVDRFNRRERTGWTVFVTGRLEQIPADVDLDKAIAAWVPGSPHALLRLTPTLVSGWRIPD
ncbi:MAG TPA: pyridoxamine 5'-phosphate oxidase family protein [Acidimicrobiales bacterium]|nr:pyridoxamine 5'-phosphate oxidase family protein [Acidimicrobiales bacterium]